jgi:hypothetical protein
LGSGLSPAEIRNTDIRSWSCPNIAAETAANGAFANSNVCKASGGILRNKKLELIGAKILPKKELLFSRNKKL